MTYQEILEARNAKMKAAIRSGRYSDAEVAYLQNVIARNDTILSSYDRIAKMPAVIC